MASYTAFCKSYLGAWQHFFRLDDVALPSNRARTVQTETDRGVSVKEQTIGGWNGQMYNW